MIKFVRPVKSVMSASNRPVESISSSRRVARVSSREDKIYQPSFVAVLSSRNALIAKVDYLTTSEGLVQFVLFEMEMKGHLMPEAPEPKKMSNLFLGLDLSTQQLKAVIIGEQLEIVKEANVHFDTEIPEFRTQGGVRFSKGIKGESRVTVPTLLWVKALDLMLQKLQLSDLGLNNIVAISGSAQQHGTIYWKNGASIQLSKFNPFKSLKDQVEPLLSSNNSPVWMDSSTSSQCARIEDSVGGPEVLASVTGSRAYERFSAAQIKKLSEEEPKVYEHTERISLVSSGLASLLLGRYASLDFADSSGMNLMDIRRKTWDAACLSACAPGLKQRLGIPVPSWTVLGDIDQYFCQRFGFASACKIVAWTGDNCASLAGMNLRAGDLCISLGTSDTIFAIVDTPVASLEGHILCSPVATEQYMVMLCFKNGSLVREKVLLACTEDASWANFEKKLNQVPPGNGGIIGLYFEQKEIVPPVAGIFRYDAHDQSIEEMSSEHEIRAVIEGQTIAKRYHAQCLGFQIRPETRIFVTGGGSRNRALLQVIANVFQANVYTQPVSNSAAYGAACRAVHALRGGSYFDLVSQSTGFPATSIAVRNDPELKDIYDKLVIRYAKLQKKILQEYVKKQSDGNLHVLNGSS